MRWISVICTGQRGWGKRCAFAFLLALCALPSAFCTGAAWGASCSVSTTPANFGQYDAIGSAPADTLATISVNCSAGIAYNIKSDPGQNSHAGFQRSMRSSGISILNYNLYRDAALSEVWGDGTGTTFVLSGIGAGGPVQHMVFGRIPGGQKVRAGIYQDLIIVTVEW